MTYKNDIIQSRITSVCGEDMPGNILLTVLATTFVFVFFPSRSAAGGLWVCKPCQSQAECDADPVEYCEWGEVKDACNRRICAKGPGERCGGALNILGQCGEGLMCRDERCRGCSIITLQCD